MQSFIVLVLALDFAPFDCEDEDDDEEDLVASPLLRSLASNNRARVQERFQFRRRFAAETGHFCNLFQSCPPQSLD